MASARLRRLGALTLALTFAACATEPLAPAMSSQISMKNGVPDPAPTPVSGPDYTGHWIETGAPIANVGNGRSQQIWVEIDIARSGSGYAGRANRYVTYYQDGVVTVAAINLGTPGRVTATPTATGLSIGITKLGESKLNLGYQTTVSADTTTLTVINPKVTGGTRFIRQ